MRDPIGRLGLAVSAAFRLVAPDPLIIAILLSLVTAAMVALAGFPPGEGETWAGTRLSALARLMHAWRGDEGIWKLLAFSMQMCLVLVAGTALAATTPVRRLIESLAERPRNTA